MSVNNYLIHIKATAQGLYEITDKIISVVEKSGIEEGLCNVFIAHTSASLLIQENADPTAKDDLERWFSRLVKEGDLLYTHTLEGQDDMPAHIRSALTNTTLAVPIVGGKLVLGVWQGIYLFEHRRRKHTRKIYVSIIS